MSPEVAEAIRRQSACDYCGAGLSDRCTNTRGEPVTWIHDRRVQTNLFNPSQTRKASRR